MSRTSGTEPCCLPQTKGLSYIRVGPEQIVVGMMELETIFRQLMMLQRIPQDVSDAEIIGMARKSNYIPARSETEANYGAALRQAYDRYYNQS